MQTPNMRVGGVAAKPITKRFSLTEGMLPRLTCPPDKLRVFVYDSKQKGLAYQITKNGARAFYFYGRIKGQRVPVKFHLGDAAVLSLDQARRAAMKVATDAAHGIDPAAARRAASEQTRTSITVLELWENYRDQHVIPKCRPSNLAKDRSLIKHLRKWHSRPVNTITREAVEAFHASLHDPKFPTAASQAVCFLRRMFTWAKVDPNPARIKLEPWKGRQRFLSKAEVAKLYEELDMCSNPVAADAIRFALLTGARHGNVCHAAWRDAHLDEGIWIIPADQSKNGKPMTIHLSPQAVALLKARLSTCGDSPWVFPRPGGQTHIAKCDHAWQRVRAAAGLKDVHFHDLRHTLASHMAMSGASLLVIGQQLGHASKLSTARYAHLEVGAVRAATNAALANLLPTAKRSAKKRRS